MSHILKRAENLYNEQRLVIINNPDL